MNIQEAVKKLNENTNLKIRRLCWGDSDSSLVLAYGIICYSRRDYESPVEFSVDDLMADDWEIVYGFQVSIGHVCDSSA